MANGNKQSLFDASIVLPNTTYKDCLEVEFGLGENLTESKVFNTVCDAAAYIGEQQRQTRFLFGDRKTC